MLGGLRLRCLDPIRNGLDLLIASYATLEKLFELRSLSMLFRDVSKAEFLTAAKIIGASGFEPHR